jgi:hypothetical protein
MDTMTLYEEKAVNEIIKWRDEKEGLVSKTISLITKPLGWMFDDMLPEKMAIKIENSIMTFMELLKDVAAWTFSEEAILKKAEKQQIYVSKISELKGQDMKKLDILAKGYFMPNKIIASLEGGGFGLGGATLVPVDIMGLFTLGFRAVQQIGSCYGFDLKEPRFSAIVMYIFSVCSNSSVFNKTLALADMRCTAKVILNDLAYRQIVEDTNAGIIAVLSLNRLTSTKVFTEFIEQSPVALLSLNSLAFNPKEIAKYFTKKKLAQLIPVLGSGVGAGINYWFLNSTCETSYMLFRELFLSEKYAEYRQNCTFRGVSS